MPSSGVDSSSMAIRLAPEMAERMSDPLERRITFAGFRLDRDSGDLHDASGPVPLTPRRWHCSRTWPRGRAAGHKDASCSTRCGRAYSSPTGR